MSLIAFMNIGGQELLFILLIVLVLFGAKKLPELARGMGQAIKEFQKAKDEFGDELHKAGQPEARSPQATVPRISDAAVATGAHPDPAQTVDPGGKGDEIRSGR